MKNLQLLVLLLSTGLILDAQPFSVRAGVGYGCGGDEIWGTEYINDGNMTMESPICIGLGNSLNAYAGVDYDLCDDGGAGVELNFASGFLQRFNYSQSESFGGTFTVEEQIRNTSVQAYPNLYWNHELSEKWGVTGRIGPVINVIGSNTYIEDYEEIFGGNTATYHTEEDTKLNVGVGWRAGASLNYNLSESLSLVSEVYVLKLGTSSSSSSIIEYVVDGENQLDDLSTSQRETNYVDKLDDSSNNPQFGNSFDTDAPLDQIKSKYNLGRSAITLGIRARF